MDRRGPRMSESSFDWPLRGDADVEAVGAGGGAMVLVEEPGRAVLGFMKLVIRPRGGGGAVTTLARVFAAVEAVGAARERALTAPERVRAAIVERAPGGLPMPSVVDEPAAGVDAGGSTLELEAEGVAAPILVAPDVGATLPFTDARPFLVRGAPFRLGPGVTPFILETPDADTDLKGVLEPVAPGVGGPCPRPGVPGRFATGIIDFLVGALPLSSFSTSIGFSSSDKSVKSDKLVKEDERERVEGRGTIGRTSSEIGTITSGRVGLDEGSSCFLGLENASPARMNGSPGTEETGEVGAGGEIGGERASRLDGSRISILLSASSSRTVVSPASRIVVSPAVVFPTVSPILVSPWPPTPKKLKLISSGRLDRGLVSASMSSALSASLAVGPSSSGNAEGVSSPGVSIIITAV